MSAAGPDGPAADPGPSPGEMEAAEAMDKSRNYGKTAGLLTIGSIARRRSRAAHD